MGRKRRAPSGAPDNRTPNDQVCDTYALPQGLREGTRVEVASGHDRTVYDAPSSLGERWSAQESPGFSRGEWSIRHIRHNAFRQCPQVFDHIRRRIGH